MTKYDPDKTYAVKLSRSVWVGAFKYKPLNEIEMAGSVLLAIIEADGEEVIDYARQV
ncbi:MAG: hypothetical protein ABW206_05305 [Agrobacterium vaccinii]